MRRLVLVVIGGGVLAVSSLMATASSDIGQIAHATEICGVLDLAEEEGPLTVLLGEAEECIFDPKTMTTSCSGAEYLAVCVDDGSTQTYIEYEDCDVNLIGGQFEATLGQGPDVIAPASADFSCGGTTVLQWRETFRFGLTAFMEGGEDYAYGTPRADHLYSYEDSTSGDGKHDVLCGFDGADELIGDGDDDPVGFYDCMNGHGGVDTCDGNDGSTDGDWGSDDDRCDNLYDAKSTSTNCGCGNEPPDTSSWI